MTRKRDNVYKNPLEYLTDFEFDRNVVSVFEDMINRSVPGYATIVHNIAHFAEKFGQRNTRCYDLGCSLGAATLAIRKGIENIEETSIVSIDTSQDMLNRAKIYIEEDRHTSPVTFKQSDIREIDINNASIVVLNFILQFIPIEDRQQMLSTIFNGMTEGGCLILSEKVSFDDAIIQETLTDIHHQFKLEQGYSELEIAQKRDAIENIMKLEYADTHLKRLRNIGFRSSMQWFQNTAFCSFFAIK